jgi:hypothetical protein
MCEGEVWLEEWGLGGGGCGLKDSVWEEGFGGHHMGGWGLEGGIWRVELAECHVISNVWWSVFQYSSHHTTTQEPAC